MDALSVINKYNTPSKSSGYNLTYTPTTNASTKQSGSTGGKRALETAGYFFNKLGLSFMRGIEGIADFTAGGIAELFGNDEYAERQMSTDWMNYNYADEWYKPRNGFEQFMGDLGGGIGSSLPALAAVAIAAGITYATAGAGATVAVPLVGSVATSTITGTIAAGTTAFLSAGGTAASEAYQKTGNLGSDEWKYAAGSGAIEGSTEAIMNLAGLGVGAVGKKLLGKSAGKVVATGVGKTAWNATKNFVSEGVEEVISDAVDPYLRRATIDPNAKNATAQELLYTGIVGGFSSLLMGGGNAMVSKTVDFAKGEKIAANPDRAKSVMAAADEYSNMEHKKATGSEVVEEIAKQNAKLKELMNKNNSSPFNKAKISELLGSLERLETIALFDKMAVGETMSILSNPDAFAKSIPNGVYIDPEGNKHTVTKETLTKGIEYKDGKADGRSISKAIKTNGTLRAIVAARVAGTVLADAGAVYTSMLEGNKFFNSNDELNEFYENATPETREKVKNEMGIDLEVDNIEAVNQKLALWKMSGAGEQYKANLGVVRKAKSLEVSDTEIPTMPSKVKLAEGESKRYADGTYDIAITRDTDGTYTIVDINEGRSLSGLSRDKLNEAINAFRKASLEESAGASAKATNKADEAVKADRKVSETDAKNEAMYERISKEVKGYDGLSAPNKRAIRSMVRKAVRLGVSDAYIVSSARYMVKTGINLQFVPNSAFAESGVNGMYRYSDGTVYLNAEINAKTFDELIVHETSHALYKSSPKLQKVIQKLAKGLTEEQKREIHKTYSGVLKGKSLSERVDITSDEFGAHFLEYTLGKDGMLESLLAEDEGLFDKLTALMKKTETAYRADKNLSPAAKRVFKAYKKALAQFSESNANMNAYADVLTPSDALGLDEERYNLGSAAKHKDKLTEAYNAKESTVPLDTLQKRYDSILKTWTEIGGEINSEFLAEWDAKKGTDAAFTIFKEQSGYKYNIELSTMCKKGVALFEAIDTIVRKEMTKKLDSSVITKEDKEILYDVLKSKGYEIPCAICYVEQARQREGVIIDAFLNGTKSSGKLGWNSVLKSVEEKMANAGVKYTFPSLDRAAATDAYNRDNFIKGMTVDEQSAFYEALREVTNEEVKRYNKASKKDRAPLKDTKPATVAAYFKGSIPSNFKLLKVLFNNPKSRFTIDEDLLYSSHTTRNLATYYGDLYSLFNAQSGVAGYKLKQSPIIYTGEILAKKWAPSTLRKSGAVRNQSNSDMQMYTLLDQVQMYIDLTAKGYYLHAYTKVVAELKLLGLSNAKINASLIPKIKVYYDASGNVDIAKTMENAGLDENGELMFDDFEGINHGEAFMLLSDPEYSKSLCGICIGYSDKHILKMLDDDRIQLIIGFHDKTNNIDKRYKGAKYAKNYNGQNEAYDTVNKETKHLGFSKFLAEAEKLFKLDKATESFSGETVYDGKTYTADDIPRLAAKMYLDECQAKGYIPAYGGRGQGNYDFTTHPNYYKLLGDFGLYNSEGHYAPLKKVSYNMPDTVPILNEDGSVSRMDTKAYIKKEIQGELEVRDRLSRDLADTSKDGILQKFVAEKNKKVSTKISVEEGRGAISAKDRYADFDKPITTEDIAVLRTIPRKSINEFTSEEIEKSQKWAYKFYKELGVKSPFFRAWFGDWRAEDKKTKIEFVPLNTGKISAQDVPRNGIINQDTKWKIKVSGKGIDKTSQENGKWSVAFHSLKNINEMISKAILMDTTVISEPSKKIGGSAVLMHSLYCPVSVTGDKGVAKLYVIESYTDTKTFYLAKIEMVSTESGEATKNAPSLFSSVDTDISIAQMYEFVKVHDKNYEANSKKPVYFNPKPVNPALLNTDGTPKVFYHGTNKVFETFKPGQSGGIYLADNRRVSEAFTKTDNVMEVYPSLRNPLVVDALVTSEFFGITSYKQSFYYEIPTPDVMKQKGYTQPTMATEEISEFAQKNGYDGVIITNVREIDGEATTDVIVFSPEQIKSAAPVGSKKANIGTFDSGMGNYRYSLSTPNASTPKFVDPARRSAVLTSTTKQYKPTRWDLFGDQVVKSQMAFTNTQAGLERLMREVGYTREEAEAQVQFARLGYSQANSIIGGKFIDVSQSGADGLKVVGKGLSETLAPILPKRFTKNPEKDGYSPEEERYLDLQMLMLHKHNLDRMGLEAKAKKQYLPLEAISERLGNDSRKLGEAIAAIGKWQTQIEVYEKDIKEAKDKVNTDADFIEKLDLNSYIEERTTKINNLRKNIDKAVNTRVKANDATKLQDMLTMDEAMLKSLTDAKYTEEDIKALKGNQAAVLSADDLNTLAGLSSITDPIEKLRAIKKIVDKYAKMLDGSIESLKAIKNKPLLGKTITVKKIDPNTNEATDVEEVVAMTADESRDIIKEYEKHYKDDKGFWEAETNIRAYLDNLMQLRVNSGLVTAELANDLAAMYPNYVPGYRVDASSGLMVVKGSSALELNKGVAKAKGSIKPIRPFHETLAEQTISAVRSARLNEIMVDIYERHKASNNPNKEKHFKIVETVPLTAKGENVTAEELYDINYADPAQKPKDNQITFYYKGEKITAEVSKDVFVGFEDLAGRRKMLWEGTFADNMLDLIMGGFRSVTINWNPAFIVRNLFKDFGDALITSRVWSGKYATKYVSTFTDIKNNSELWQLYVASGGLGNSFVDEKQKRPKNASKRGFEKINANANPASWLGALGQSVENVNKFVEQLPRFAAFKIALESGASVAQAMNEAAEITTNFQRGGTVTRFFNKIVPFLNASVQGFFKYPRRIMKAFGAGEWDKAMKDLALLLFNAILVGIVPMVINELLCKDVEGYEKLRNTDKENYYLIPMGDGKFVKLPRGRIQAAMSSVTNLTMGKSTVSETWQNVSSQVSPWGTMTRTIFSPIKDVSTNTTWYGGEIEGMQFDNVRPSQRKDENTSAIAIWIADVASGAGVEWSPKKIDYLLGQYTGFFGDVIIDATKQKAMGNPLTANFTVDSVTSNRLSNDFYEYYNEAQFAKNEGNETAIYQLKYLNKVKKQIRELYDQKSAIQSNSALSNKEKLEQTRILQSYINGLYAAAIDQFSTVTEATEATSGYGLEEDDRFREVIRISFGAEAALESWNKDVYAGAKLIERSGVDFEKYYDFYFAAANIDSDKDKNGNTVSGSKRAKVKKLVTEMDISTEQKVLLLASKGYAVKDGEFRGWTSKNYKTKLLRYIFSLSISKEEKAELAELCGFKVVNGRVIS